MGNPGNGLIRVGPFELDHGQQLLVRNGQRIPLTQKAFDTLAVLAANPGELVSKQDLLAQVWPDVRVEESTLTQNIFTIRKAIGDGWIETVPRRGYRLVIPGSNEQPRRAAPAKKALIAAALLAVAGASVLLTRSLDFVPDSDALEQLEKGKQHFERGLGGAAGHLPEARMARQIFEELTSSHPGYADAHAWLARTIYYQFHQGFASNGALGQAQTSARRALELDPRNDTARAALIDTSHSTGRPEEGLRHAKVILANGRAQPHALFAAAQAYYRAGLMDRAISLYERALAMDPLNSLARERLAFSYYIAGQYRAGLDVVTPLIQSDEGLWCAMHLYGGLGDFEKAIQVGSREVAVRPWRHPGWLGLGRTYKLAGRPKEAREAFESAVRILNKQTEQSASHRTRMFLALAYAELGDRDAARREGEASVSQSGGSGWNYVQYATALALLGDKQDAADALRKAFDAGDLTMLYILWEERPTRALSGLRGYPPYEAVRREVERLRDEFARTY